MRFFTTAQQIAIPSEILEKARRFSETVIKTVDYRDSYQFNQEKVKRDHYISKIGEEAVFGVFCQFTSEVTAPDYEVYSSGKKSWDFDLKINGVGLAVKTQTDSAAQKYGLSWTFQSGKRRRDPILDQPDAWLCFVRCIDTNSEFTCVVYPPCQLKSVKLSEPKLHRLRGEKRVVYAAENELVISNF